MQTEINYQQLGQRVREKRKAMNIQQKDMAIAIGTATNHLSDIERGRKKPSLELLMRISSFLDTAIITAHLSLSRRKQRSSAASSGSTFPAKGSLQSPID